MSKIPSRPSQLVEDEPLDISDEGMVSEPNQEILHPTLQSVLSRNIVPQRQIIEQQSTLSIAPETLEENQIKFLAKHPLSQKHYKSKVSISISPNLTNKIP